MRSLEDNSFMVIGLLIQTGIRSNLIVFLAYNSRKKNVLTGISQGRPVRALGDA